MKFRKIIDEIVKNRTILESIQIGQKFKSVNPTKYSVPGRGTGRGIIEGEVIEISGDEITIRGMFDHEYVISKKEFISNNKFQN